MKSERQSWPEAIIFDMDGLMLDTERIYQYAWQCAANELGYQIPEELFDRLVGLRTEDCETLMYAALGREFPLATFHARWMAIWEDAAARDGIDRKPGLTELLDRIDELGLAKAVATSSTRCEAERSLSASGLAQRFPIVVTGEEVEFGKPAPDIYEEAARRLGVRPAVCWAFEDSSAGATAAAAAGMRVYIVPDLKPPADAAVELAAGVLGTLNEALPLLDRR